MRVRIPLLFLLASTAAAVAPTARAAASYDSCAGFISSLPAVITTQGVWCFDKDLSTASASGNAITVAANNVTIDCNGFKLGGLGAGPSTTATGIHSEDRLNTTVRGCTIRGFVNGVRLLNGGGHLVEGNRLDGNLRIGVFSWSDATIIRRNLIVDTGGSTSETDDAWGILAYGSVEVVDNSVDGVDALGPVNGDAYGIYAGNDQSVVAGNRVRNIHGLGTGKPIGIYGPQYGIVADNHVLTIGANTGIGIECADTNTTAVGNVVVVFQTGLSGCYDGGGNVVN
jgi:hypothetical protein